MSVWVVVLEVLGWCLILTAALSLFSVIRTLRELIGPGIASEVIKPDLRRDAWERVLFWPFYLLVGVPWATNQWTHGILIWPRGCLRGYFSRSGASARGSWSATRATRRARQPGQP